MKTSTILLRRALKAKCLLDPKNAPLKHQQPVAPYWLHSVLLRHTEYKMLTQQRLKEVLFYDPLTGIFTWNISLDQANITKGMIAGGLNDNGYIRIRVDTKRYMAHRLAYLYMTGEWPEHEIDHDDTNRANNKWDNIRNAKRLENRCNTPFYANNKLGVKGVHLVKDMYKVQIQINKKKIYLGRYRNLEDARSAYNEAAEKYQKEFAHISTKVE